MFVMEADLEAEPAFGGNRVLGAAGDQTQPGGLWLEGFQLLALQIPA